MVKLMTSTWLVLLLCVSLYGQTFDSGSQGTDGAFNPPSQVPMGTQMQGDCSAAPGCTVTVPLREPPNHVFHFTTVTIGRFVTVKFQRNVANTPVFVLAQGDVTINGTIDVSGQNARLGLAAAQGGPGGYNGGLGGAWTSGTFQGVGGAGGGPGGGSGGVQEPSYYRDGSGGGFGSRGFLVGERLDPTGVVYGIAELLPLIGGSGGGGGFVSGSTRGGNGGGGGGALLIASSGVIDLGSGVGSAIVTNGGNGERVDISYFGGGGSGGAIRLIATTLRGSRSLTATGGAGGRPDPPQNGGGVGRIRLEGVRIDYTGGTNPQASIDKPGQVGPVFPTNPPTLRVVSIGGVSVPGQLTSDVSAPDVSLPVGFRNPVRIELEATNVPSGTPARVIISPQLGSGQRIVAGPVNLTGPSGQPKRGTIDVNLPSRGLGLVGAVIDSVFPEPSSSGDEKR